MTAHELRGRDRRRREARQEPPCGGHQRLGAPERSRRGAADGGRGSLPGRSRRFSRRAALRPRARSHLACTAGCGPERRSVDGGGGRAGPVGDPAGTARRRVDRARSSRRAAGARRSDRLEGGIPARPAASLLRRVGSLRPRDRRRGRAPLPAEALVLHVWESWVAHAPALAGASGSVMGMAAELDEFADEQSTDISARGAVTATLAGFEAKGDLRGRERPALAHGAGCRRPAWIPAIVLGSRGTAPCRRHSEACPTESFTAATSPCSSCHRRPRRKRARRRHEQSARRIRNQARRDARDRRGNRGGARRAGHGVDYMEADAVTGVDDSDAVVVGSAVYMKRWRSEARRFLKRNAGHSRCGRCRFQLGPLR